MSRNPVDLEQIKEFYLSGVSTQDIAQIFNLSRQSVYQRISLLKPTREETRIRRERKMWQSIAVAADETKCWPWTGPTAPISGYGICSWKGRRSYVHRIIYEIFYGYKPKLHILHKQQCKLKRCANPHHLYEGTHQQNMRDRDDVYKKGRRRNPIKHTPRQIVYQVKRFLAEGKTNMWIAQQLKLQYAVVCNINAGKYHQGVQYP